jgi:hypothetical protein
MQTVFAVDICGTPAYSICILSSPHKSLAHGALRVEDTTQEKATNSVAERISPEPMVALGPPKKGGVIFKNPFIRNRKGL